MQALVLLLFCYSYSSADPPINELTISDDYGSKATMTRTVIIEPEPNMPPVIDMVVRQGSELN